MDNEVNAAVPAEKPERPRKGRMSTVRKILLIGTIAALIAAIVSAALIPFSRELKYKEMVSFMDPKNFDKEREENTANDFEVIPELSSDPEYQAYNILKVAFSQLGYQEGSLDGHGFKPDSPQPTSEYEGGLTKYGLWYSETYSKGITATWYSQGHWCSMFISWCVMTAGVPTETFIWHADCDEARAWFQEKGQLKWSETWSFMNDDWDFVDPPEVGDIMFISSKLTNKDITHVGLVYKVEDNLVYTIEGNTADSCDVRVRTTNDPTIIAYGHPIYNSPAFPTVETVGRIQMKVCIICAAAALGLALVLFVLFLVLKREKGPKKPGKKKGETTQENAQEAEKRPSDASGSISAARTVCATLAVLLTAGFCGCAGGGAEEPEAELPYNIHLLDPEKEYTAEGTRLFEFRSDDPDHYVIQGGYFDGKYYYVASLARPEEGGEIARIIKLDANGKKIKESEQLPLDHANNITYVPGKGLLVTHCQSDDGHYNRYSLVNISSLKVTEYADLEHPFFAMAYAKDVKKYASGEWSGQTLDIWDSKLNCVKHVSVETPGTLSQGVFADAEGIYFVRSSQNGLSSEIRVYNWDCELVRTIPIHLEGNIEPESINIVGGKVYVIGNDWSTCVGAAFLLEFQEEN